MANLAHLQNSTGEKLKAMEEAAAMELLPALMVLGMLSILGNLGNGIALYVYYTRFNPSSTRTYIIAMSVFDLLFCCLSLPGEILDLRFSLTYTATWICRLQRLITPFLTLASGFILVVVALDRRRKICDPFGPQLTLKKVNLSVIGCSILALLIGFPFAVMNGHHTVHTDVPGVVGSACSVDDQFLDTSFPLVYNIILALVFVASTAVMIVSYVQIARKIVKHKRKSLLGKTGTVNALALLMRKQDSTGNRQGSSTIEGRQRENTDHASTNHEARNCDVKSVTKNKHSLFSKKKSHVEETSPDKGNEALDQGKHVSDQGKHVSDQGKHVSYKENEGSKKQNEVSDKQVSHIVETHLRTDNHTQPDEIPTHENSEQSITHPASEENKIAMNATADATNATTDEDLINNKLQTTETAECSFKDVSPEAPKIPKQKIFRSQSVRQCEQELEMAMKTLIHAVSDDMLSNSRLFKNRLSLSTHTRSASVGDEIFHSQNPPSTIPSRPIKPLTTSSNHVRTHNDVNHSLMSSDSAYDVTPRLEDVEVKVKEAASMSVSLHLNIAAIADDTVAPIENEQSSDSRKERFLTVLNNTLTRFKPHRDHGRDDADVTSRRRRGKNIPSRTTWMMFVLTAIFIISYVPYLTITAVRAAHHGVEVGLTGWKLNLYIIALRSYFINSVVNPLVYSFCSQKFRLHCRHLFSRRGKTSISD